MLMWTELFKHYFYQERRHQIECQTVRSWTGSAAPVCNQTTRVYFSGFSHGSALICAVHFITVVMREVKLPRNVFSIIYQLLYSRQKTDARKQCKFKMHKCFLTELHSAHQSDLGVFLLRNMNVNRTLFLW